jgi:hypothetical protein
MTYSRKAVLASPTCIAILAMLTISMLACRSERGDKEDESKEQKQRPKRPAGGGVKLDRETQERTGIETQALAAATIHPEIAAYGTLEEDPSEIFVLRSPIAGVLHPQDGRWPALGADLSDGTRVGTITPRLAPVDQVTLADRLASARAESEAAQASVVSARQEYNRLKELNAADKNVSDKALQEAVAHLAAEEARLKGAQNSAQLLESALQSGFRIGSIPLEVIQGGQVLEVSVQPEESIEAGQALLRVGRFDRLLARIYLPPGIHVDPVSATIAAAGQEEDTIPAERVALSSSIDPKYQGQVFVFRLTPRKPTLRPGQAVTAHIPMPGATERGVLIPSRAVVRFQGQSWVYVKAESTEFFRRAVSLEHEAKGGWLSASGFRPGERVVVTGAQTLLSEEMKSQLEPDQDQK